MNAKPGRKAPLTRLQKVLIANGGPAHRTLRQGKAFSVEMQKNSKNKRRKPTSKQRRDMEAS